MSSRRWTRKWAHDVETDVFSPLPTQVVSNEEYVPRAQPPEQRRVPARLAETARRNARRLGISRRQFMSSSAGMASAFIALNTVFGRFFEVTPVEALEAAAADERKPSDQFVFDIQTHHVAAPRQFPQLLGLRCGGRPPEPPPAPGPPAPGGLYLPNHIKESFLDSDTPLAVAGG